jgi:hypothetical protein
MVTVNHAAAQLFETAASTFGDKTFSRDGCVDFLLTHYAMNLSEAKERSRQIITFCLRHGIIEKSSDAPREADRV